MRAMFELGLMDSAPVDVGEASVPPRKVLETLIDRNMPRGDEDIVLVRVTVEGRKNGKDARAVYEMIDYKDETTGLTAMMRGTALPSSIVALMMARGETPPGAIPQELAVDGDRLIEEIHARGMPLDVRFETA
jgi:lysine 6-dehydrogenase